MSKKIEIRPLLDKPIWQLNGHEFFALMNDYMMKMDIFKNISPEKRYVYGLDGIMSLFGCSKPTAERIKKSGIIDDAISQGNRTIVVDAELALKLFVRIRKRRTRAWRPILCLMTEALKVRTM